jgi:alpha-glucosidase
VTETKTVTAQDKLDARLAPGGGLAVRIVPRP